VVSVSPGQLEQELAQNAWLTVPADTELVFEIPFGARWQETAARLGVDLNLIAGEAGHA
jgi:putative transcriptional regulator